MKKTSAFAGVVAVSIMIALAVLADQERPAGSQQLEFGAPPQMKDIAFMEGVWDVDMKYRMAPDAPWEARKAVATYSMILDGCVMKADYSGDMMDMQSKGIGLTCYNRAAGKSQTVWTDNMGMGMSVYEGGFEGDRMVFTGEDIMPGGVKVRTRITNHDITDAAWQWSTEHSADGGTTWYESMKATYTKRQIFA